jgi:hypothetical protein
MRGVSLKPKLYYIPSALCADTLTRRARSDRWELGRTTGLILPRGVRDNLHRHQYFSGTAFFPKDENKPHLSCIVSDTFISPDSMLRSEVHGAVALIKYQLTSQRCSDHRIKPVSSS